MKTFKKLAALVAVIMIGVVIGAVVNRVATIQAAAGVYDYAVQGNRLPTLLNGDYTYTGALDRTPVSKTAAFTASKSVSKYDLDSTAGAFLVSLPDSASADAWPDGHCVEFSLTVVNGATSFSPSAVGDLLDASQAAYAGVDALGDSATICYDVGTTNYYFQSRYIH
jgi:hypothetical protein